MGRVRDGYIEPSDAPGIGAELDEEEMSKHRNGQVNFFRPFDER